MLLLEHEIDGLLKRRIDFSVRDREGGHRVMDYTGLLNEKENQIVEPVSYTHLTLPTIRLV